MSTAAVYWNSAKTGTKPFVGGAANPTNVFSSDRPRKIFTPGFGPFFGTSAAAPHAASHQAPAHRGVLHRHFLQAGQARLRLSHRTCSARRD